MSLDNLVKTGQLKSHKASAEEIRLLLDAAARNLADAGNAANSPETRFDCGYKALMQSSLVVMLASGYRPDTKRPGHHAVTIQSLAKTLGIEGGRIAVLDKLREKRNLSDYTGMPLDEAATASCIQHATGLLAEVREWLAKHHPELS